MAEQTEMEIAGVKFKGGKIFLVLTALSTLGGGAWATFEFYKDYMDMREMITSYVAPDLSGFQEQLSVLNEELKAVKEVSASHVKIIETYGEQIEFMQNGVAANESASRDMKNNMRDDISRIEKIVDAVEDDIKEVEADVRAMIQNAEERFENKRDALQNDYDDKASRLKDTTDDKIKDLENSINKKIQRALDNPLAN